MVPSQLSCRMLSTTDISTKSCWKNADSGILTFFLSLIAAGRLGWSQNFNLLTHVNCFLGGNLFSTELLEFWYKDLFGCKRVNFVCHVRVITYFRCIGPWIYKVLFQNVLHLFSCGLHVFFFYPYYNWGNTEIGLCTLIFSQMLLANSYVIGQKIWSYSFRTSFVLVSHSCLAYITCDKHLLFVFLHKGL